MSTSNTVLQKPLASPSPASVRRVFLAIGLVAGLLLGWPLLVGDDQGQVNILAALALLALLPLLTLLFSLFALLRHKDRGMAGLWRALPFLPAAWKRQLRRWRVAGEAFWWLFYGGQWLAVGFSAGNLLALGLLLLFTDLHFVWRSTLLDAGDLEPLLRFIATPWSFWDAAQPSLELLARSRDSRIEDTAVPLPLGSWWPFLLVAQLCYALIPRLLLAFWASRHLGSRLQQRDQQSDPAGVAENARLPQTVDEWPEESQWVDAAWLPAGVAQRLPQAPLPLQRLPDDEQQMVVVVRAWEPPMGELADRLRTRRGLLLPLDWEHEQLRPPRAEHLDEWRRFAAELGPWRVLRWEPPQ